MIEIQKKLMVQYVIVATGKYGSSYHLVKASRKPTIDEARDIAIKTGALEGDEIKVENICCDLMFY